MQELSLEFSFKARYFQSTEITVNTRQVWFVLHGYGHLARFFIKKFDLLKNKDVCVIAPEGLSRFYLEELEKREVTGNNRVGATWMTAENRLMDIENYLRYLDAVHHEVMINFPTIPVTILGFSQGAATASRWAVHNEDNFERLIIWSGIFPPDMDFKKGNEVLSKKKLELVYGKNDPFITDKRLSEIASLTEKLGLHPPVTSFEGGHEIDEPTLLNFI